MKQQANIVAYYATLHRPLQLSDEAKEIVRLTQEIKTLRESAGPVLSHFDIERIYWRQDRIMHLQSVMYEDEEEFKRNNAHLYPPEK